MIGSYEFICRTIVQAWRGEAVDNRVGSPHDTGELYFQSIWPLFCEVGVVMWEVAGPLKRWDA